MALYDLVTFKKLIQDLSTDRTVNEILQLKTKIETIKSQVPVLPEQYQLKVDQLLTYCDYLIGQINVINEMSQQTLDVTNFEINQITHQLFSDNYELETRYGSIEHVRNSRRIYINEETEQKIKNRILLHTSWRYPALEIGCRDGEWTQYMVASDPLYLVDRHEEFLQSTAQKFTDEYQRRLRRYTLINHDLSAIPKNQMAFVFSWGYFNYVSLDTMRQYLQQVLEILRPGGTFLFSYNDGDTPAGAGMAENFAQTYMPKSMLTALCESLGYEVHKEYNYQTSISLLEIKKPGELTTIKLHQVMGKIEHI